jgi:hypothetical protein
MPRGYLVVEGHGELRAAAALINRLWVDLGLPLLPWADPIRGISLTHEDGVARACGFVRSKGDADALLIMRDEDDLCPRITGPETARWVANLGLPFAAAVILAHREYEAWFLPCLHLMAGRPLVDDRGIERPGIVAGSRYDGDPEAPRDVKGILTRSFPKGRTYKPTLDQLPLTRLIDFAVLRGSGMPSFGTLERALRFLSERRGANAVYPPPAAPRPAPGPAA